MPDALFLVFTQPNTDQEEAEYNSWYDETHIPELLEQVEGFRSARRYRLAPHPSSTSWPWPPYLAVYEITGKTPEQIAEVLENLRIARDSTLTMSTCPGPRRPRPRAGRIRTAGRPGTRRAVTARWLTRGAAALTDDLSFLGITGHIAIVTGGARGIGAAICDGLLAQGAVVACMDSDRSALHDYHAQVPAAARDGYSPIWSM